MDPIVLVGAQPCNKEGRVWVRVRDVCKGSQQGVIIKGNVLALDATGSDPFLVSCDDCA